MHACQGIAMLQHSLHPLTIILLRMPFACSLEQQLATVSEQLGSVTVETRQMLSAGASMWAGPSGLTIGADGPGATADESARVQDADALSEGDESAAAEAAGIEGEDADHAAPPQDSLHPLAGVDEGNEGAGDAPGTSAVPSG
jgi:hypothetical protein